MSVTLVAAPAGADLAALKSVAVTAGVTDAHARISAVIATCVLTDTTLTGMPSGEVSKIATASVPGSVSAATAVVAFSPVASAVLHKPETAVTTAATPTIAAEDAVAPYAPGDVS